MPRPPQTIVVGVDGSPDARVALDWAIGIAAVAGARLLAVHAVGLLDLRRGDEQARAADLSAWTTALDNGRCKFDRRLVPGDPVSALLRVASNEGAALIVVGSRGEGATHATTIGSTSLTLVGMASCPVVVVPAVRHEHREDTP